MVGWRACCCPYNCELRSRAGLVSGLIRVDAMTDSDSRRRSEVVNQFELSNTDTDIARPSFLKMRESKRVCVLPDTKLHAYSEVFLKPWEETEAFTPRLLNGGLLSYSLGWRGGDESAVSIV